MSLQLAEVLVSIAAILVLGPMLAAALVMLGLDTYMNWTNFQDARRQTNGCAGRYSQN